MTGLRTAYEAIDRVNCEPEKKFAAVMVASAVEAAKAGDDVAREWLVSPCSLRWLVAVTPEHDDCERVRAALLATLPAPVEPCDTAEQNQEV